MKRVIINIFASALLAVFLILGIDIYTDHRLAAEATSELTLEEAEKTQVNAAVQNPKETKTGDTAENQQGTSVEAETDTKEDKPVAYVDASAKVAVKFNGTLAAESAVLINMKDKSIIYKKNAEEELSPASTTKLMTAITALRYLNPNQKITVGEEIYMIGEGSSTAKLAVGDELTVEQLVQGMLISSGNDAAYVLAVNTSRQILGQALSKRQAVDYFIQFMNANVEWMELEHTHFNSPDGYDADNQYTSAGDLAVIAYEAYQNQVIRNICKMQSVYIAEKDITWHSTNELLNPDSIYYYDKAIGMKTGSTGNAGKCLVSLAQEGEQLYLCVVLNSDEEGRWNDSVALLEYGFGL